MKDLYGLFGEVLTHSYSPKIHTIILEKLQIKGFYHLFELKKEDLKTAIEGLKVLGARGINVTIPHKINVLPYIDEMSKEAEKIGSVNTVKFAGNRTIGYNTDYFGLDMTFRKYGAALSGKKVVVLGNGGAAVTLVHYLKDSGIASLQMVVRQRDKTKPFEKIMDLETLTYNEIDSIEGGDILINTTPCGMYPHMDESPVPKEFISRFAVAFDLIYNPAETLFLKYARESGLKCFNGLYMLVSQAISAQELWNDLKLDDDTIDEIYEKILNS